MSAEDILNKQKVAIYTRVSTHWQVDKDSLSVQKRELIVYADYVLGIQDYEVFEDPGFSGKNTDRPAYQLMMSRLRTGEFSHLLVWKIDRISRNLLDFSSMYKELKDLGVIFVSKNEKFDTSSPVGEAMLKIILVFAELERNMTAERVTSVMLSRANNGQWNGGRIPYGYDYDRETHTFSINPEEKKVYDRIVSLYEEHQSLLYICKVLNNENIYPRSGRPWSPTGIHKILRSIFYKGDYLYNVHQESAEWKKKDESEWIIIPNHHPALIDEARFDRIQFILTRNKRGGPTPGQSYIRKNVHIFGGLIKCGICGSPYHATIDKRRADGWRPSIYLCATRRKDNICQNKYVSDVSIGPFVFGFLRNLYRVSQQDRPVASTKTLQNRLLSGEAFQNVDHIDPASLKSLLIMLRHKTDSILFTTSSDTSPDLSERQILQDQRSKDERALNRLQSLYLYGSDSISEKDYVTERQKIIDDMDSIDRRLLEITEQEINENQSFIEKASYLLLVKEFLGDSGISFDKYIRNADKNVQKTFLRNTINCITVNDGAVTSLEFKNGIIVNFFYKTKPLQTASDETTKKQNRRSTNG